MKTGIIERLGQSDALLPNLVAEGLCANDRVKARLGVLQAAARHARDPHKARFDMKDECRTAGLDVHAMEELVNRASLIAGDEVAAPGIGGLAEAVWGDMEAMTRPVATGDEAEGAAARSRLDVLRGELALPSADTITLGQIARLTGLSTGASDSLHRLIMDLHKALNRLSATYAQEEIAGARVYGLDAEDRPAVEAFMAGVEETRRLKFDHPGLATSATRAGNRLTIQNDIGETDAHVVVMTVEADAVTVTYTDVHLPRAKFFAGLLDGFPVAWSGLERKSAEGLGEEAVFYLVTGRLEAPDAAVRNGFLKALGASLVFLIDWNKARKVLRTWVSKSDAVEILDWAARLRIGHRGFLELGGSDLVASAVHHAAPTRIGFGERLDNALGREAAVDFLKSVLLIATQALLEGNSVRLVRDRIEAELIRHLERVEARLLAIAVRQAGLAREIAADITHVLINGADEGMAAHQALAVRARRIEEKADHIALDARNEIARFNADRSIERLVNRIEEVIDELEQAAFIASLLPAPLVPALRAPFATLCNAAVGGTEAAAAGVAAAIEVPEGQRVDSEDALAAVGRLIEFEHAADEAERAVTTIVLRGAFDLNTALCALDLARTLERATDILAGVGHLLRAHILSDLAA